MSLPEFIKLSSPLTNFFLFDLFDFYCFVICGESNCAVSMLSKQICWSKSLPDLKGDDMYNL